ncbi:MAG: hypothetical protein ACFFE4_02250 [Candidatus Thorarchaeota archaeon]
MSEDAFNGAMAGFAFFGGLFNQVAEDIGEDKALKFLEKMSKTIGTMQGTIIKGQVRRDKIKDVTPSVANTLIGDLLTAIGMETETVDTTSEKVHLKLKRCPVYEAGRLLGLDTKKICQHSTVPFMDTILKKINRNLSYELERYRTGSDDCCEESITLKKEILIEK